MHSNVVKHLLRECAIQKYLITKAVDRKWPQKLQSAIKDQNKWEAYDNFYLHERLGLYILHLQNHGLDTRQRPQVSRPRPRPQTSKDQHLQIVVLNSFKSKIGSGG